MKLGIIFKKEFRDGIFGDKVEYHGDEITIRRETEWKYNEVLTIRTKNKEGKETFESFLVSRIQLIYLGGWNE